MGKSLVSCFFLTHSVYLLLVGPTAANPQLWLCCGVPMLKQTVGQTNGWTDRQTSYHFIDPAPHTMQAVP